MSTSEGSALKYDARVDPASEGSQAKLARLVPSRAHVLDLGCGAGATARVLLDRDCLVTGIELDPAAAKIAATVCERVVVGDLDDLDLELELGDQRFDVVLAGDVLEHLKDPERVLRAVRSVLAPGGFVAVSVPNVAHGSVRLALLHGDFPYAEKGLLDRTHRQFLTRQSAVGLMEDAGYAVLRVEEVPMGISASEVPFPDDALTRSVLDEVAADPSALVYQYVITAWPDPATAAVGLAGQVARLDRDLAAVRDSGSGAERRAAAAEERATVAEALLRELRGQVEMAIDAGLAPLRQELLVVRDQLMHRDHDVRRVADLFEQQSGALRELEEERSAAREEALAAVDALAHQQAHLDAATADAAAAHGRADATVAEARAQLDAVLTSRTWVAATRLKRLFGRGAPA